MNYISKEDVLRILREIYDSKKPMTSKEAWKLGVKKNNVSVWIIIINLDFSSQLIMEIVQKVKNAAVTKAAIKTNKLSKAQLMEIIGLQGNASLVLVEATNRIFKKNYKERK